jgi:hypothetical protein
MIGWLLFLKLFNIVYFWFEFNPVVHPRNESSDWPKPPVRFSIIFPKLFHKRVIDAARHDVGFNKYQTRDRLVASGNRKSG